MDRQRPWFRVFVLVDWKLGRFTSTTSAVCFDSLSGQSRKNSGPERRG